MLVPGVLVIKVLWLRDGLAGALLCSPFTIVGLLKPVLSNIEELARREYGGVEGKRLKPVKAWVVQPKGKRDFVMVLPPKMPWKTVGR